MVCQKCGTSFEGAFCPNCGTKADNVQPGGIVRLPNQQGSFSQPPVPPQPFVPPQPPKKNFPVWAIVLICVGGGLLLALIIGIASLFTFANSVLGDDMSAYESVLDDLDVLDDSDNSSSTVPVTTEPVQVYDDENVTIWFDSVVSRGVQFIVENKTDKNITIQADSVSVNRRSVGDIIMSDDVAPQSKGKVVAKCDIEQQDVYRVSGELRIVDFKSLSGTYNATFVDVEVAENAGLPTLSEMKMEGTEVYKDENVVINYKSLNKNGVVFEVKNLTDKNITIQADSVSVNKVSIGDIIMSDDVSPQSIGEVVAKCDVDTKETVTSVGGQLRVIDFSSKNLTSYDAAFSNITVAAN